MYIITGQAKGREIKTPRGSNVRPTTSRVKKSIFDILGDIKGNSVLDIFAGSGNLGIEALSRGARQATFIENDKNVLRYLRENIHSCGYVEQSTVLNFDFKKALSILTKNGNQFEIIFIDPPYAVFKDISVNDLILLCDKVLSENGEIVIEHNVKTDIVISDFDIRTKKYGGTLVSFVRRGN